MIPDGLKSEVLAVCEVTIRVTSRSVEFSDIFESQAQWPALNLHGGLSPACVQCCPIRPCFPKPRWLGLSPVLNAFISSIKASYEASLARLCVSQAGQGLGSVCCSAGHTGAGSLIC